MNNDQITSDLSSIKTTLERMDRELFGNGQPGRLHNIESKVEELESFGDKVRGAGIVVGGLFTVLGTIIWKHLTGR